MSMVGTLLDRAAELCEKQRHEKGIELLEEAARLEPDNALVHYELGFCYAGGCGLHSLYDPEIAIEHLRRALRASQTSSSALFRAKILSALGNAYIASAGQPRATRLLSAIDCCRRAAALFYEGHELEERAREEFNEANAWCDLPEDTFPEKWERAVTLYEQALKVRKRRKDPGHYASTLQNLGTAYHELKTGNRTCNIAKAVACYHEALRVRAARATFLKNAGLHNNMGNAYITLAEIDPDSASRHARRALRHFDRALKFSSRNENPCDYAVTQFNRGHAYLIAASQRSLAGLEQAASCFHEAQECFVLCGRHEYADLAQKRLEEIHALVEARQQVA